MCKLCGEDECKNGGLCRLPQYIRQVKEAIDRVQQIDTNFCSEGFGLQVWDGSNRPANVDAVWNYMKRQCLTGFTCCYCWYKYNPDVLQVDHYIPWRQYIKQMLPGNLLEDIPLFIARVLASDPANLVCACASCNASKSDRDPNDPAFNHWKDARKSGAPYRGALHGPQPAHNARYLRHQKYSDSWQKHYGN